MSVNKTSYLTRFMHHPSGVFAGIFILLLVALGVAATFIPAIDPHAISNDVMEPPSSTFILGTDELGRSVFAGILYGIQVSVSVGFFAAIVATVLGILIGSLAGFYGGWLDTLVMRIAEFFQVIPSFILAAVIVALAGPGLTRIILVVGILAWPQVARVIRGEVIRVKQLEFVDAVRCLGIPEKRILFLEVIPNAVSPVLAVGSLIVAQAILLEASLSFLGLSSVELVSWGRMLNSGQRFLYNAWWLSFFPGTAIFLTVLAFNVLGDAIGAALNPRTSGVRS
jgi:peptide/nickel transport system permease protein